MEKRYTGTKAQLEEAQNKPKSSKIRKWICALIAGTIIAIPVSATFSKEVNAATFNQQQIETEYEEEYEEEVEMLPETIEISDVSKISLQDLEELKKQAEAQQVQKQIGITRPLTPDINFCNYDLDTFGKIIKQVKAYTEGIDKKSPQLEKFMEIYQRVGANIEYDYAEANKKADPYNENLYNSRKLTNGLLKGKALAAGYTDILAQLLKTVGIDAKEVSLKDKSGRIHYINMVNIDGKNYYTDVTRDSYQIKQNKDLQYCLKSESDIKKEYTILTKGLPQAKESMSKQNVLKYRKTYKDIKKINPIDKQQNNAFLSSIKVNVNPIQIAKNDKKTKTLEENDHMI